MEKIDYIFMEAVGDSFELKPAIIELGSRIINIQKDLSARNVFDKNYSTDEYIGLDFMEGEGVDKICDVRELPFEDGAIDTVIAMNLFEHVEESWLAFDEIKRVISKDGVVIIGTPFSYEIHGCPEDFYRYTPDFYLKVFKDFETKITVTIGYHRRPKMVYFIGGNAETLKDNIDGFSKVYAEKHDGLLKPFSKVMSSIRSKLCPNHFRNDIKFQHTFEIRVNNTVV